MAKIIEIIKSQKGKNKIIHNGFVYNMMKKYENHICWRCIRRNCSGKINTNLEIQDLLSSTPHWHSDDNERITKIRVNRQLKKSATESTENFENTLLQATHNLNENDFSHLNKIDNMRDYFTRMRNKKFNNNKNEDIEILEMYKYTFDNNIFLQYDNGYGNEERIIIFYTNNNLKILEKSNLWLGDGTFYISPKGFEQVYILHGSYFSKIIPLVYIFMKKKNTNSYNNAFSFIKGKLNNTPKYIVIDFELAAHNSLKNNFINSEIKGCYFHLTQIIVKFLKTNKLMETYKMNHEYKKFIKYMIFLTFVPPNNIKNEFKKICLLKRDDKCYEEFIIYFKNNFIENIKKLPTKEIAFWSSNQQIHDNIPTTTNSCEAYHRNLNSKIVKKDQPLGKIIDVLKKEERRINFITTSLKSGKFLMNKKDNQLKNVVMNFEEYSGYEFYDNLGGILDIFLN
ncbi:hypothetical protein DMUE_0745 [Dictyocoela muelleri]|nr:hypothetical protein DMUE_0745 [Dictyocoela muelleri]